MNLYEKILHVQSELKAPKGQTNSFGKYKYRSAEDIIESVKPLLAKYGLLMVIADDMVSMDDGNRYYVKASVTVIDVESGEKIGSTAYAREEEVKKGMDSSQVTGAASSYARKYAMNGMFAIDDTKDADTDEYTSATRTMEISADSKQHVEVFNRNGMIEKINSMSPNEKQEIFNKYHELNGKIVKDAKFLTTDFLKKVYNKEI